MRLFGGATGIDVIKHFKGGDYHVKLFLGSFQMRMFTIVVGMGISYLARYGFGIHIPTEFLGVLYVWLATSALYYVLFKRGACKTRISQENLHFSYYFFSVIYTTTIVHYLGGAEWIAFVFYIVDLVYANILMRRIRGIIVTLLMILSYSALVLLEFYGILPRYTACPLTKAPYDRTVYFMLTNILVINVWFLLVSYCVSLAANIKEQREKWLMESKNRLVLKSSHLEEVTKELRKNEAENKYMRSAAMGYIAKKEFEIEQSKKNLADQIEKLRETQKSMLFMIEDLNSMSAQLKDTRDHLEDKVRERTDELLDINKKLHRSERLSFLGKLAGSVTHELRNPLAVLKNAAYYLDMKFKKSKDEKVLKYVDVIKKEITKIDSIIDDIMGFAKTKAPVLKEVNVRHMLENIISMLAVPDLVEIKAELEKDLPEIAIDSNLIAHALVNIANNAIVAMSGSGKILFRAYRKDEDICIEIEDNGPGIPPDQRDLIFEPLYSSKPKGTGLGLPIAKMIVENQDGSIDFESTLGHGTIFRIYLPVERKRRGE